MTFMRGLAPDSVVTQGTPTCKNPNDATVPPCLHQAQRMPAFMSDINFPLAFFKLWILTENGKNTFTAAGAYDSYTLIATNVLPSNSARVVMLYQPYPPSLAPQYKEVPPLLVVANAQTGVCVISQ